MYAWCFVRNRSYCFLITVNAGVQINYNKLRCNKVYINFSYYAYINLYHIAFLAIKVYKL